jgi:ABC-type Fe3+-citrate transport system substrate-binding protein
MSVTERLDQHDVETGQIKDTIEVTDQKVDTIIVTTDAIKEINTLNSYFGVILWSDIMK